MNDHLNVGHLPEPPVCDECIPVPDTTVKLLPCWCSVAEMCFALTVCSIRVQAMHAHVKGHFQVPESFAQTVEAAACVLNGGKSQRLRVLLQAPFGTGHLSDESLFRCAVDMFDAIGIRRGFNVGTWYWRLVVRSTFVIIVCVLACAIPFFGALAHCTCSTYT